MRSWAGCMRSGRRWLIARHGVRAPAGATMYVTLEPCAHEGRQPPCVEAILGAGIPRVVIASEDPSEKAAGRGPGILRDGGVEVVLAPGAEAASARLLNQAFRKHARTGLPLVTLKLAMSLDGRTATATGDSPWISGEGSRALVHRWRAESDAIAAGIGTVLADDPLLTARVPDARQPLRVVFDSQARLPSDCQLLATLDQAPVLVVVSPEADSARTSALEIAGAEVHRRRRRNPRRSHLLCPRRPRPSRDHQPLPRGWANSGRRLCRGRPDRRVAYLHCPGAPRWLRFLRNRAGATDGARRLDRAGRGGHPDHGPLQGVVRCSRG